MRSAAKALADFQANLIDECKILGAGSFGVVKLFRDRATGHLRAVKYVPLGRDPSLAEWEREESVLWALAASTHPSSRYVVRLFASWAGHFESRHTGAFVMEACDRSVLQDIEMRVPHIPPLGVALRWAAQLMSGLSLLHSLNVLHRDLKPNNVLLQGPGDDAVLKIADMGSSRREAPLMTSAMATVPYRPPEMLLAEEVVEAGPV